MDVDAKKYVGKDLNDCYNRSTFDTLSAPTIFQKIMEAFQPDIRYAIYIVDTLVSGVVTNTICKTWIKYLILKACGASYFKCIPCQWRWNWGARERALPALRNIVLEGTGLQITIVTIVPNKIFLWIIKRSSNYPNQNIYYDEPTCIIVF